ncbi:MAG: HD domain-containing phosphohydrolase [Acidobacteriota bacterium]
MPAQRKKISLIYFVVGALLVVGLVPLVLTGWLLSNKSGSELRSAENRYQIQLVQEKAQHIEMFGKRYGDLVANLAIAIELSNSNTVFSSPLTEAKLGSILKENPDLLALYIKPANADSLSVFRAESIKRDDVELIASQASEGLPNGKVDAGELQTVGTTGERVMTFSTGIPVAGSAPAKIVAVASLRDVARVTVGFSSIKEDELWHNGLPIIFVVDSDGNTVFHPDQSLSISNRPMNDLKIVQEWRESGIQVASALVPFSTDYAGVRHDMIGAYSTARISPDKSFGVITMQDESTALASVGEMRMQTWAISISFALFALIAGYLLSRLMTQPLLQLVSAAKRIADGDFSSRVDARNMTEIGTLGATFNVMTDKIEEQIANLAKAAAENRELFVGTVKALAAAIDGKDKYTRGHSERVARISVVIGKRLGMGEQELDTLRMSALLHDVGKIAIDDAILKKPAALTDAEFEIMKTHPQAGYKIMSQIPAMKDFLPGMYMHHEMVNGKGYPQGLTGDQIPLQAKIISVADTFDAMTIDRPYSKGMELSAALDRLRSLVGTRYQSEVVEALIDACHAGEVANGIVRQLAAIRAAADTEAKTLDRLVA